MADLDHIIETFDFLTEWDDRYRFLEELGEKLGTVPTDQKIEHNLVHGCASNVWVTGYLDEGPKHHFHFVAEAEQPIIRGLVYLILQIFIDKTPDEILLTNIDETLEKLHLDEHLSTQRHIGMYALVQTMKSLALPYAEQDSFTT